MESYISLVNILSKRYEYDYDFINSFFDTIVDNFVSKIDTDSDTKRILKTKLMNFQKAADYSQMCDDKEVAIYLIDDLRIAFDINGKYYGNFPSDGEHKRGQIGHDPYHNEIKIIHKDKTYIIDKTKMKCKNWKIIYDKTYNDLKKEFDLLNMKTIENDESKPNFKR